MCYASWLSYIYGQDHHEPPRYDTIFFFSFSFFNSEFSSPDGDGNGFTNIGHGYEALDHDLSHGLLLDERRTPITYIYSGAAILLGGRCIANVPAFEWFVFHFRTGRILVGHLFYMIAYRQLRNDDTKNELLWTQKIRFSLPIVLIGTGLVRLLFPALGALKIPVLVYSMILVGMVMTALFRYGRTSSSSFWMVFVGAGLFMISDSLLAINKFYTPLPAAGLLIMLTYISAQYLIVKGALRHEANI